MGQYYYPINLTKRQFIHPHKLGDGLKLLEFGMSANGTMTALAILLADGNGRGGGDLRSDNPIIGSWAGDRIVIGGDYADPGKFMEGVSEDRLAEIAKERFTEGYQKADQVNLHMLAGEDFEDISAKVLAAMLDDSYFAEDIAKQEADPNGYMGFCLKETLAEARKLRGEKGTDKKKGKKAKA